MTVETIGKELRELRKTYGISIRAVAPQLGITEGYLTAIENGRAIPSLPVFLKIVEKYGFQIQFTLPT